MIDSEALRSVLLAHADRYPRMQPQDAVKLLYQNEFGGGHLISDPDVSLERLNKEYAAVAQDQSLPLFEEIGDGLARVNLAACGAGRYTLSALNRDFVRSASLHTGEMERFLEKLDLLREVASSGAFGFSSDNLKTFLGSYIASGCPMLSHSDAYRAAYSPAYRIILKSLSLPALLEDIALRKREGKRLLIALDGRCASGKSTLAARLAKEYNWSLVHMDDFFLRPEQRTPERYATPGENVDHERFYAEVLKPLRDGADEIVYQLFDCQRMELGRHVRMLPRQVVLIEGSYSCHPALWDAYDLRVFLTVDPELQLKRIEVRNGPAGLIAFREKWIPFEEKYFAAFDLEHRCDYSLEG